MLFAQEKCRNELEQANAEYGLGRFDRSELLIKTCLEKRGILNYEKARAYELMALNCIGRSEYSEAYEWSKKLIKLSPNYVAYDRGPDFRAMLREARAERSVAQRKKFEVVLIVAASSIIVYLAVTRTVVVKLN